MRLLLCLIVSALAVSCARLPDTSGRPTSQATRDTAATSLSRSLHSFKAANPRRSGFHPLVTGSEAFDARVGLAKLAERSLDLQYYIWKDDTTGTRMLAGLLAAAERGVRVRVLIDDWGVSPKDADLLALDAHEGIEVRLFNPVMNRSARMLGLVFDFNRVNRRMHNKAFIADNQVAIVGGRNIGDEYFDAHDQMNFADFDVAAVGPVVRDVSRSFDDYWNSPSAVCIADVIRRRATESDMAGLRDAVIAGGSSGDGFARKIRRGEVSFLPGDAQAVADDPAKVRASTRLTETHLVPKLRELVGVTQREILIVSPYFIPGKSGVDELVRLRRRGVRVVVLTNSLASTDVAAVHAGYKRYRKDLLRAGVELYENKPSGGWGSAPDHRRERRNHGGSSGASLHAKTFAFDRNRIFVGSMNLDPRSILLNTELGILIENSELAQRFTEAVLRDLEANAYRLSLEGNRLVWSKMEHGKTVRFTRDPHTTTWQRAVVEMLSWLPIEGQL